MRHRRAISSVVERLLHTQEVAGSIPASPTMTGQPVGQRSALLTEQIGIDPGQCDARTVHGPFLTLATRPHHLFAGFQRFSLEPGAFAEDAG